MIQKVLFLLIAAALTIIATFVQQFSSSDRPFNRDVKINGTSYSFSLPVLHEGNEECLIEINLPDSSVRGNLVYKLLNSSEEWKSTNLIRMNDKLVNVLPIQNANIKISYYIELISQGKTYFISKSKPIIVRFQETVPKYILFPQVMIMFLALIIACFSGLLSIFNADSFKKYANLTFYLFSVGVFLSLLIHIIAFRHLLLQLMPYNDLSFYKNLIIFFIWFGLFKINKKYDYRYFTLTATVFTLILYCMPQHFIFGWLGKLIY